MNKIKLITITTIQFLLGGILLADNISDMNVSNVMLVSDMNSTAKCNDIDKKLHNSEELLELIEISEGYRKTHNFVSIIGGLLNPFSNLSEDRGIRGYTSSESHDSSKTEQENIHKNLMKQRENMECGVYVKRVSKRQIAADKETQKEREEFTKKSNSFIGGY